MKLNEFIEKHNLHDSLLESIEHDGKQKIVKLIIDFCYWQQDNYKEGTPETGLIVIEFTDVSNFTYLPYQINSDEIIDVVCNNDSIIFVVYNDIEETHKNISITAKDVFINAIESSR